MRDQALQQVDFRGMHLWARVGDSPSQTYVAVPPICRHLGLNPDNQRRRILAHAALAERSCEFAWPSRGGTQMTLCIRLDALNLWLAMIQPHKGRDPERAQLLAAYQRECCDVLYQHFFGAVPVPADVIERHDLRALRLVVDNTRDEVRAVKGDVRAVKGQVEAQGYQLADVRSALDEQSACMTDVRATCEQNGLDIGELTTRVKRVDTNSEETAAAIRAVRKQPRAARPEVPSDAGRKFADAVRRAKQEKFDFGDPA